MTTFAQPLDDNRRPGAGPGTQPSSIQSTHEHVRSSPSIPYSRPRHAGFFDSGPATTSAQPSPGFSELELHPGNMAPPLSMAAFEERSDPQALLPLYLCAAAWAGCSEAKKHLIPILERLVLEHYGYAGATETLTPWVRKELAHEVLRCFIHTRRGLTHFSDRQARYALRDSLHTVISRYKQQADQYKHFQTAPVAVNQSTTLSDEPSSRKATQLTSEHKEVLRLYEIENLTYHQIARRLSVSIGTIKSRLYRTRRSRERLG